MKNYQYVMTDCSKEVCENNETVFNKDEALEINGNEEEFLKELAEMFLVDLPEQMIFIKMAVNCRNSNALEKSAHKLKGAVANFGNTTVFKSALSLETMGRDNRWDDVEETYEVLTREAGRLVCALKEFVMSK